MLVWQLSQPSRDSLQDTAGQHIAAASIRSPDKHKRMEQAAGKERCQQQQQQNPTEGRSREHRVSYSAPDLFTSSLHNMTFTPTRSRNGG